MRPAAFAIAECGSNLGGPSTQELSDTDESRYIGPSRDNRATT